MVARSAELKGASAGLAARGVIELAVAEAADEVAEEDGKSGQA